MSILLNTSYYQYILFIYNIDLYYNMSQAYLIKLKYKNKLVDFFSMDFMSEINKGVNYDIYVYQIDSEFVLLFFSSLKINGRYMKNGEVAYYHSSLKSETFFFQSLPELISKIKEYKKDYKLRYNFTPDFGNNWIGTTNYTSIRLSDEFQIEFVN